MPYKLYYTLRNGATITIETEPEKAVVGLFCGSTMLEYPLGAHGYSLNEIIREVEENYSELRLQDKFSEISAYTD